ncbi:MAG: hypothetical protein B7X33_03705 [Lysobacterales bacterium 13-68-4]|jgi:hypothetical protein|nr:MAG: hypothetical protein B7X45_05820 [Xanthomonadales bacterium 15-68-25]OZB66762.1 MAG: hypothetical protein B7X39_08690 [Xanthomonadales bacterium 14-68-21]OZB69054.1 MAG: hypothetical protein B7X33_03705 [Xanthomonadales bacterium 13-68-4]
MRRTIACLCALTVSVVTLAGCQTTPAGMVKAARMLPDRPAATAQLPTANKVCSDGTPVVSLGDCPSAAQQREHERQRISQAILDIHAHGG